MKGKEECLKRNFGLAKLTKMKLLVEAVNLLMWQRN